MSAGSSQSHGGRPPSRLCSRTHTEPSSGTRRRTRAIWVTSMVMVSWRATASSSTVESSARRVLPAITPDLVMTARTASKIRSGASEARSLLRHRTSTVEWNDSSVRARPAAAFQAMSVSSRRTAWRTERPSRAWRTMTVAMTSAGTEGRPRAVGNRSSNSSSGNTAARCSARKACTEQVRAQGGGVQQRPVQARGTLACPIGSHPRRNRESTDGYPRLLSSLLVSCKPVQPRNIG